MKYIRSDRVHKFISDLIEDYVDMYQEIEVEVKQNDAMYAIDELRLKKYEEFIQRLEYLKTLVRLEARLHGKEED